MDRNGLKGRRGHLAPKLCAIYSGLRMRLYLTTSNSALGRVDVSGANNGITFCHVGRALLHNVRCLVVNIRARVLREVSMATLYSSLSGTTLLGHSCDNDQRQRLTYRGKVLGTHPVVDVGRHAGGPNLYLLFFYLTGHGLHPYLCLICFRYGATTRLLLDLLLCECGDLGHLVRNETMVTPCPYHGYSRLYLRDREIYLCPSGELYPYQIMLELVHSLGRVTYSDTTTG